MTAEEARALADHNAQAGAEELWADIQAQIRDEATKGVEEIRRYGMPPAVARRVVGLARADGFAACMFYEDGAALCVTIEWGPPTRPPRTPDPPPADVGPEPEAVTAVLLLAVAAVLACLALGW